MDKQIWFMVYGFVWLQPPNMVKYNKQVHAPRNAKSSTTMSTLHKKCQPPILQERVLTPYSKFSWWIAEVGVTTSFC